MSWHQRYYCPSCGQVAGRAAVHVAQVVGTWVLPHRLASPITSAAGEKPTDAAVMCPGGRVDVDADRAP